MAKVPTNDPNKLQFSSENFMAMISGLPFFLFGVVILGAPYFAEEHLFPPVLAIPLGGIFTLLGGIAVFGGSSATIDKSTGKIATFKGVLGIGFTLEYKIADVKMVTLKCEVVKSGDRRSNQSHTSYPIILEGLPIPVKVDTTQDENESRVIAEEVAIFLDVPMKYYSHGKEIIRQASELNQSVREIMAAQGRTATAIPKPPGAEATHTQLGTTHKIHIPAPGFQPGHYLAMMIGAVAGGGPAIFLLPKLLAPNASMAPFLFLMLAGGFSAIIFGVAIYSAMGTTDVEVSPTKMTVQTSVFFYRRIESLDASKIEELRIDGHVMQGSDGEVSRGSRSILARADDKSLTFGWWLDEDELKWLLSICEVALSS